MEWHLVGAGSGKREGGTSQVRKIKCVLNCSELVIQE